MITIEKVNSWILSRAKNLGGDELRQLYATTLLILGSALVHTVMLIIRAARGGVLWFDIGSLVVYAIVSAVLLRSRRKYSLCIVIISWEIFLYSALTSIVLGEITGLLYMLLCFQIQLDIFSYKGSRAVLLTLSPIVGVILFFRDAHISLKNDDPFALAFAVLSVFVSLLLLNRVGFEVERLLKQRRDAETAQLEEGAYHDPLTGLFNRRWLNEVVPLLAQQDAPFCVAMLDIDHFKAVNDRYGHDAGDLILRRFAETISNSVRGGDSVFRYGGEEFVVLFSTADTGLCRLALARISQTLADDAELLTILENKPLTFSGGLTAVNWDDFEGSLSRSDTLLYEAKSSGRNRVCG